MPVARDAHFRKRQDLDLFVLYLPHELVDHCKIRKFVTGPVIELHGGYADVFHGSGITSTLPVAFKAASRHGIDDTSLDQTVTLRVSLSLF